MSGTALMPGLVRNTAVNATWALDKRLHCRSFNSSELLDCFRKQLRDELLNFEVTFINIRYIMYYLQIVVWIAKWWSWVRIVYAGYRRWRGNNSGGSRNVGCFASENSDNVRDNERRKLVTNMYVCLKTSRLQLINRTKFYFWPNTEISQKSLVKIPN